jgi:hypothetical protein
VQEIVNARLEATRHAAVSALAARFARDRQRGVVRAWEEHAVASVYRRGVVKQALQRIRLGRQGRVWRSWVKWASYRQIEERIQDIHFEAEEKASQKAVQLGGASAALTTPATPFQTPAKQQVVTAGVECTEGFAKQEPPAPSALASVVMAVRAAYALACVARCSATGEVAEGCEALLDCLTLATESDIKEGEGLRAQRLCVQLAAQVRVRSNAIDHLVTAGAVIHSDGAWCGGRG